MKVEGMQYPLQVKPIGAKNGHHHEEKDLSDDAVYFEPEEHREKKQNPQQQEAGQNTPESILEAQVTKESDPSLSADNVAAKKTGEKASLNIIV